MASPAPTSEAVMQRIGGLEQAFTQQKLMNNDLRVEFASMQRQITELATRVQGQITGLENENTRMRGQITEQQKQTTGLQGRNTEQQGQITGLQIENTRMRGRITEQQALSIGLQGRITDRGGASPKIWWGHGDVHLHRNPAMCHCMLIGNEYTDVATKTADIKTYNGEYSALIFRVEGMSTVDQVLNYANGLKPRTRSYVKLENPETLSAAMDLAITYEVTHFVDDVRDHRSRQDKRKISTDQAPNQDKSSKGNPFRGKGRFKLRSDSKRTEDRTCYHGKRPAHIKANCFIWKKEQEKQGNGQPRQ
ncbi:unnamed protein product [Phytophthora fragariaefolia]|uniref:Unnamed protein product n=1 Tax=Phytophthora fragariaefolia TaxID=1490495 RepID=A0A9W6TTP9_9STRA|nr:unnamed protein product [Phytophthora fragariaefolia]